MKNYSKLVSKTQKIGNVKCYKLGLWKKEEVLNFTERGSEDSTLASREKFTTTIQCVSLDKFFENKEKPTLIKMDIEGAEFEALLGAKNLIREKKPKLQICLYHKPRHLWLIPIMLKNWVPDYKLYVGHHSYSWGDIVLYARVGSGV